mmetsp:Transcript_46953/g.138570  ORF Transcript_46953/g.138570 Transcript_46953/m.138570 type:complete len:104 (+) Transcript_46953:940-1251(+)
MRYPARSLPSTATAKATSCLPSATPIRSSVVCGSAAIQWTEMSNSALMTPSFEAGTAISVSTFSAKGNAVLTAQKPVKASIKGGHHHESKGRYEQRESQNHRI